MSDDDFIVPRMVRPGMRVEIVQRPWVGTVLTQVGPDGAFRAMRDGDEGDGIWTSWAVESIGSIRRLPDPPHPLPTEAGTRFYGKAQDHPAEWWFVSERRYEGVAVPIYVSSGGFIWPDRDAERFGLVRLPDPDIQ